MPLHNVNWTQQQEHVALRYLPRQRSKRGRWRWLVGMMLVQAVATVGALLLMDRSPTISQATRDLYEWIRGAGVDWLEQGLFDAMIVAVAALVAVAVIALPVARYLAGRWTRGLGELHVAIQALARDDKLKPVAVRGVGEIDYLLVAFNEMAGRLLASRRELVKANDRLERRVADRTAQLERATELAQQASEAKSKFLATMSHELRTPLNGVNGSLSLLQDQPLDKKQAQIVRMGRLAGDALLNLINDILDFSAIEAGQLELADQPFELVKTLEQAVTIVSPMANQRRIDVTHRVDPDVADVYRGDPARLRQVLINLVNNAIKFTDAGYVDIHVSVDAQDPRRLCFAVQDTGIGMSQEGLAKLFNAFSQAGNDQSHERGGTGLGLMICKQLTGLMGGGIEVESEPGHGSTFRFTIAAEPVEQDAVPPPQAPVGQRLLLIETCQAVVRMVRGVLEPKGCRVEAVDHADAAARAITECGDQPYDLVLIGRDEHHASPDDVLQALRTNLSQRHRPRFVMLLTPEEELTFDATNVVTLHRPLITTELTRLLDDPAAGPAVDLVADKQPDDMFRGKRILVAEDNAINQFVITNTLESFGVTPDIVDNGEAAVEAVSARRYDLVLMDNLMPRMDGFTAARHIRELEAAGQIPGRVVIVALTANVASDDHDAYREAGMDACLAKPFDIARLREVMLEKIPDTPAAESDQEKPPQPPAPPAAGLIDLSHMRVMCNNNTDRLEALLGMTDEHFRKFKDELAAITPGSDPDTVRRLGHTIAGSAFQLNARPLAMAARALENAQLSDAEAAASRVVDLIDVCLEELKPLRAPGGVMGTLTDSARASGPAGPGTNSTDAPPDPPAS